MFKLTKKSTIVEPVTKALEREVADIVRGFTDTVNQLITSADKASHEASASRDEIEKLEEEAKALDAVSANATKIADKIKSLLN
jgi:ABC-type transporter Mla subunit MlaD